MQTSGDRRLWLALALVVAGTCTGCGDDDDDVIGDGDADADTDTDTDTDTDADADTDTDADADADADRDCASPAPAWLMCEDFERGGGDWRRSSAGTAFMKGPAWGEPRPRDARGRPVPLGRLGRVLPGRPESGYQGASLGLVRVRRRARDELPAPQLRNALLSRMGALRRGPREGPPLLDIGGSQPDDFWYHGTAGACRTARSRWERPWTSTRAPTRASSTRTPRHELRHELRELHGRRRGLCRLRRKGPADVRRAAAVLLGANLEPDPPVPLPVGQWFCLEMMMQANTAASTTARWPTGRRRARSRGDGLAFRTSPTLA